MIRRPAHTAFVLASLVLSACGGASQGPTDPSAMEMASAQRTLESSTWRVVDWAPEVALEMNLQALLPSIVVRFEQGRLRADAGLIHVDRSYRLEDVAGPQFKILTTDEAGVTLETLCQFNQDLTRIEFHGETSPWRGIGHLARAQSQ
jgi:hypothetical protein